MLLVSALTPLAVLKPPVVLLPSASTPLAVLKLPVVLLCSAPSPTPVLMPPVVLKKRRLTDGGVESARGIVKKRPAPIAVF